MSLVFNNSNYATTATSPVANYGASGLTIMAWTMMDGATGAVDYVVHLGQDDSTSLNSCTLIKSALSAVQAAAFDGTTSSSATTGTTAADANWHHYAATFASATSRYAYLDGTASPESTATRTLGADFDIVRIGASCAAAGNWNGKIAHVAIWDKVLSGAQITSLAGGANPTTIESANLVAYWPLTTDDANLLVDTVASLTLTGTGSPTFSSTNPTVDPATALYLKLLANSTAQSAASVAGAVFNAPTGSDITGTKIGEFTGAAFSGTLESSQAVLKVPVTDFGGTSLTTASTPVAIVRNATYTTGAVSCTVIEE